MRNQPLVSIITPTYNRASTLSECIESIRRQTYPHFELIIIDDGSTDYTEQLIHTLTNVCEESRIRYFQLPQNTGHLSDLRNFGLMKAKGEFVAFIDSDDYWHPYKLEIQLLHFQLNPKSQWAFCDVIEFHEEQLLRNGIYQRLHQENGSYEQLFQDLIAGKLIIFPSSVIIKTTCLAEIEIFNSSLVASDQEFLIRLAAHTPPLFLNNCLTFIRKHEANMSVKPVYQEAGHLEVVSALKWAKEQQLISPSLFQQRMAIMYYGLGKIQLRENHIAQSDHYFAKAFQLSTSPLKLRMKIALKRLHIQLSDR